MPEKLVLPIHGPHHHPLGPDPIPGGYAVYEIKVFEDNETVVALDDAFIWEIPYDLAESSIVRVEAFVSTPSSAGAVQVQVRWKNQGEGGGSDILSQKISIDAGKRNSKDSLIQPVIAGNLWPITWGDHLVCDVDNGGAGAMGLGLIVTVLPLFLAQAVVQGAKGDAGGVTNWRGAYSNSTTYSVGDAVSNGGTSYVARLPSTGVEPGVTAGWQTYWMVLSEGKAASAIEFVINGNGRIIDVGRKQPLWIPFNCAINEVILLADFAGNIQLDVWKTSLGAYSGVSSADSIVGASPPKIVAGDHSTDAVLSGWNTSLLARDILVFNVVSCSSISLVNVSLNVIRS